MAAQIPSSTLLTYDGWGHGAYLISLTMPAKSTHCPANSLTQR